MGNIGPQRRHYDVLAEFDPAAPRELRVPEPSPMPMPDPEPLPSPDPVPVPGPVPQPPSAVAR